MTEVRRAGVVSKVVAVPQPIHAVLLAVSKAGTARLNRQYTMPETLEMLMTVAARHPDELPEFARPAIQKWGAR